MKRTFYPLVFFMTGIPGMLFAKSKSTPPNIIVIFCDDLGYGDLSSYGSVWNQTPEIDRMAVVIAWWPGTIKPGTTCHAPASVLDFYHTFAALANRPVNDGVKRDGIDISDYFFNPGAAREPRPYFYWHAGYLMAVRYGEWKLNLLGQFSEEERGNIMKSTYNLTRFPDGIELYDLQKDPGEMADVSEDNPEVVNKLLGMAEKQRNELGEYTNKGPEVRKTLSVETPAFLVR